MSLDNGFNTINGVVCFALQSDVCLVVIICAFVGMAFDFQVDPLQKHGEQSNAREIVHPPRPSGRRPVFFSYSRFPPRIPPPGREIFANQAVAINSLHFSFAGFFMGLPISLKESGHRRLAILDSPHYRSNFLDNLTRHFENCAEVFFRTLVSLQ